MIETSQELIDKMRAEQTVSARVNIISYKGQTIKQGSNNVNEHLEEVGICQDTGEVEYYESYKMPQLNNLRLRESGNYAVFEGEGISLSGMQCISKNNSNNQFGWWNEELSDSEGNFNSEQIVEWYAKQTGQTKLNIVFSQEKNEYAVDFTVEITLLQEDGLTEETKTYNITDNTETIYTLDNIPDFSNYYDNAGVIDIKITKWSKANARAKICQLSFGEILTYEDEQIVDLSVKKGVSLTNQNTESKTIDLTVQDEDEEYNIFEPTGALASLNTNSALSLELGCVIDDFIYYVKVDEFNIEKPKKEQNSLEVTITGYGIIKKYSDTDFGSNYYDPLYPQQILDSIFGYEDELLFKVDSSLNNAQIRSEYGTVKIPDGLNKVATAVRGNIIETIDNTVLIKQIQEGTPVAIISMEEMFTNPEIEKEDMPSFVEVNKYNPTSKGVQSIYNEDIDLQNDWYTFKYSSEHTGTPYVATFTPEDSSDIQLGCIFLEDRALYYAPKVKISGGDLILGKGTLEITGNVIEMTQTSSKYELDQNSTSELSIDSESIANEIQARNVFDWLKANLQKCFKYNVEIQDTFTYEIGDTVLIETGIYVDDEMMKRTAIITDIEYQYNGALHYTLTLKGA